MRVGRDLRLSELSASSSSEKGFLGNQKWRPVRFGDGGRLVGGWVSLFWFWDILGVVWFILTVSMSELE